MTRVFPTLPTDLTKARTVDLLGYLNAKLAEEEELKTAGLCQLDRGYMGCELCDSGADHYEYSQSGKEQLSDITTELLRRHDNENIRIGVAAHEQCEEVFREKVDKLIRENLGIHSTFHNEGKE